ncbi:MAG: hypothetical protein K0R24_2061, partial [Gammaproteobacteria bacterium]|nr:hypothetical protein [Gammaproteobacteria bacterium]
MFNEERNNNLISGSRLAHLPFTRGIFFLFPAYPAITIHLSLDLGLVIDLTTS